MEYRWGRAFPLTHFLILAVSAAPGFAADGSSPEGLPQNAEVSNAAENAFRLMKSKPKNAQALQEATQLMEPALKAQAEELQKRQAQQGPEKRAIQRGAPTPRAGSNPPAATPIAEPAPVENTPTDSAPVDVGPPTREIVFDPTEGAAPADTASETRLIEFQGAPKYPKPSPSAKPPN